MKSGFSGWFADDIYTGAIIPLTAAEYLNMEWLEQV